MTEQITVGETRSVLIQNLRSRPELGLSHAVADRVLEPVNPFEPQATRTPRRWFVLLCLLMVVTIGVFVYFNFFALEQERGGPEQLDRFELEAGH